MCRKRLPGKGMSPGRASKEIGEPIVRETKPGVVAKDLERTHCTFAEARSGLRKAAPKVRCAEVEQPTLEGTHTHVLFPSVVAIHEGRVWVGDESKRLRSLHPQVRWDSFAPSCPAGQDSE